MHDFLKYKNSVIVISAILTGLAVLFFGQAARLDVCAGLALGGGWSIAKLWLRARRLQNMAEGRSRGAVGIAMAGNFALYVGTAAVLAAGFVVKGINWWAIVAGLFVTNAVMIGMEAMGRGRAVLPNHGRQGGRDGY